jgi:transposase
MQNSQLTVQSIWIRYACRNIVGSIRQAFRSQQHGVVRWRCVDLQGEIKARFGVAISERHVGRLLQRLKFTRLSVRPRHPQADEAVQQDFKKTSPRP